MPGWGLLTAPMNPWSPATWKRMLRTPAPDRIFAVRAAMLAGRKRRRHPPLEAHLIPGSSPSSWRLIEAGKKPPAARTGPWSSSRQAELLELKQKLASRSPDRLGHQAATS